MTISSDNNKNINITSQKSGRKIYFKHTSPLTSLNPLSLIIPLASGNPCKGILILTSIKPCPLKSQNPLPSLIYQSPRYKKEPLPYTLYHILYLILTQYFFFKEVHKVIGKHQKLKPCRVTSIAVGYHLIQSKAIYSLFYKILYICPLIVKSPYEGVSVAY